MTPTNEQLVEWWHCVVDFLSAQGHRQEAQVLRAMRPDFERPRLRRHLTGNVLVMLPERPEALLRPEEAARLADLVTGAARSLELSLDHVVLPQASRPAL